MVMKKAVDYLGELVKTLEDRTAERQAEIRIELDDDLTHDRRTDWLCASALAEGRSILAYKIAHPDWKAYFDSVK